MDEFVRKLALWRTKTFKPIMTHDELEPIMSTLGFVALPATSGWKEYVFYAGGSCRNLTPSDPLPRLRLPFPRIDGLHIFTYRAFFDAITFYLDKQDISDHFHVRGMPLQRNYDLPFEKKFRRMNDEGMYVYRDGTLDQATAMVYSSDSNNNTTTDNNSTTTKDNNSSANSTGTLGRLVPLKDIIV